MDSESLSQSESTTVTKNALSLDDVFVLTARSPEHAKKRKLPLTPLSKKVRSERAVIATGHSILA